VAVPVAAACSVTALLVGLYYGTTRPELRVYGDAIVRGAKPGVVAITFDDGPDPRSTEAILDALKTTGDSATFFLLADQAEHHPDLARRIADEQEVGVHGLHHDLAVALRSPGEGARVLEEATRRIAEVTGVQPVWYRPPFGIVTPRLVQAVNRTKLVTVWCSLRTRDGTGGTAEWLRARCASATQGDILLMHEGARPARDALPQILDDLHRRGLRSVTISDMVAR